MHRHPRAVGTRVVRLPVLAATAAALVLLFPMVAAAAIPADSSGRATDRTVNGRPWSADAVVLAHTAPEAVAAGTTNKSCTGWTSTSVPPDTIRVFRTRGPAKGTVQVVPFKDYVPQVMPSEWPAYYPLESLKAGAVQVKNYGWYFTIVYRGGKDALGNCYDVRDTSADQNYNPEKQHVYPDQALAVQETWGVTLRRFHTGTGTSDFLLAEYRTGFASKLSCGIDADGKRLYQRSILRCGHQGMDFEQILRIYLEPKLEIVTAGTHDIVGDPAGDAAALVRTADVKSPVVFSPVAPDSLSPADVAGPALGAADLVGAQSVDLDANGHDDLLALENDATAGWELDVSTSDGTAYADPTTWASGKTALPDGSTLLSGDFDGDGHQDAAILVPGSDTSTDPPTPTATLQMYRNTDGGAFAAPVTWWTGPLDMTTSRAYAGDPNGDGRTDLMVVRDLGDQGLEYDVASSLHKGGGLDVLTPWYTAPDERWDTTRNLVGDYNRDGRDDLWIVMPNPADAAGSVSISVLKATVLPGTTTVGYTLVPRWTSADADGFVFDSLKIGAADANDDGFGDLVLYADLGDAGTQLATLTGTYSAMTLGTVLDDATLDWNKTTPY